MVLNPGDIVYKSGITTGRSNLLPEACQMILLDALSGPTRGIFSGIGNPLVADRRMPRQVRHDVSRANSVSHQPRLAAMD